MINMQPYQDPGYFILLAIGLLPIMIGLLYGHRFHTYETIISTAFLLITFGGIKWHQGIALICYIIFEMLLIWWYFHYRQQNNKTWVFCLAVILAIVPLVVVKITPAIDFGRESILGFLGISYLTFKVVGMIMEIRDGMIKKDNFDLWTTFQFIIFFPTISSGPIDRYRRFKADYDKVPEREKYVKIISKAVHYVFLGFLYKFLLAYFFGQVLVPKIARLALAQGGWSIWTFIYGYAWTMDLFFDFAGYSLFAVATSYIMGIETPMNFNKPFISHNVKDFWNRWHMTLSFWFRDYIYMRLVFLMMKKRLIKSRIAMANIGYITLFLIMGFWHGLTWYYITYGLCQGLAMVVCDAWLRFKKKHRKYIPHNKFTEWFAIFLTFNYICFTILIFSGFLNTLFFVH